MVVELVHAVAWVIDGGTRHITDQRVLKEDQRRGSCQSSFRGLVNAFRDQLSPLKDS